MKINFSLITSDTQLNFTPEEELRNQIETYQGFLAPKERVHIGRLFIHELEGIELSIVDEMWHIALHLCRLGLKPLLEGEKYTYCNMMTGIPMDITPKGESIIIVTIEDNSIEFDKDIFIREAFDCGTRYFDFLEELPHLGHEKSAALFKTIGENVEQLIKEYFTNSKKNKIG